MCMANAAFIKQVGGFDKRLRSAQDWDLWVKLAHAGRIVTVPKSLVNYHVHFNARISNNMQAKYIGARRFYFKYKTLMRASAKKTNVRFICYIKSRQVERKRLSRFKHLFMAIAKQPLKTRLLYFSSSMPRILMRR